MLGRGQEIRKDRCCAQSQQGRQRRIARHGRQHQPRYANRQPHRPCGHQQNADRGGHAFAALEAQPDGEIVAHHRPEPGGKFGVHAGHHLLECKRHRAAFADIKYKCQCRRRFVAGAQHVGGTYVARTNGAQIAQAEQLGKNETKRNRSNEVAAKPGDDMQGCHDVRAFKFSDQTRCDRR